MRQLLNLIVVVALTQSALSYADPGTVKRSCTAICSCFGSVRSCTASCYKDCSNVDCQGTNAAVSSLESQAYLHLSDLFSQGIYRLSPNATLTQSEFLAARQNAYLSWANIAISDQGCSPSKKRSEPHNLEARGDGGSCVTTASCSPYGGSGVANCLYNCHPCDKSLPATGYLVDQISADYATMLSQQVLIQGPNVTRFEAQRKAELCTIARNVNAAQGCSAITGSALCDPPVHHSFAAPLSRRVALVSALALLVATIS